MNPTLEIFSQGEEVVTGQTVDTNAAWLAQESVQMGFAVTRHTAVGDKLEDLIVLLKEIAGRSDCCICTGGLGPTQDDLTAEAVAQAFALPLEFDPVACKQIEQFYLRRNRTMPAANRKQAMFPGTAESIDNGWGTAPGFTLHYGRCRFVFLPGVPSEMRNLFNEHVKSMLAKQFNLTPGKLVTIKTIGIGESDLQTVVDAIQIPERVQLGFRATPDHVETKLLFSAEYPIEPLTQCVNALAKRIGSYVFGIDGLDHSTVDLTSVIDRLMSARKYTAAFVETATQGLMAAKCIDCTWLLQTSYQRSRQSLGNDSELDNLIESARAIATATQQKSGADLVLVQLYQGDNVVFADKDSNIVLYNTLLTPEGFRQSTQTVGGPSRRKQNQAALLALDLLRRYLQHID